MTIIRLGKWIEEGSFRFQCLNLLSLVDLKNVDFHVRFQVNLFYFYCTVVIPLVGAHMSVIKTISCLFSQ